VDDRSDRSAAWWSRLRKITGDPRHSAKCWRKPPTGQEQLPYNAQAQHRRCYFLDQSRVLEQKVNSSGAVTRQSRGNFFGLGLTNVLQIYEIVYSPSDWDEKLINEQHQNCSLTHSGTRY
jgi:hypothetical protein